MIQNLIGRTSNSFYLRVAVILFILAINLFARVAVGQFGYSGYNDPPKYGDFEAQRHWMEITVNLPISEWYYNTTDNDLDYWGIDYPPLSAYHSWLCGKIAQKIIPESVELFTSRGYETPTHKFFMRCTVIVTDILLLFPAIALFISSYYKDRKFYEKAIAFFFIAAQPGLILIDHGHFQYNAISLSLALFGISFILEDYDIIGSIFFSLSLNFKQMSLYYAPAFFFFLLGKNLKRKFRPLRILMIGVAVILTFAICWFPFLFSKQDILQVLKRIFPVHRGLYEDKVANFWCTISPIFKPHRYLTLEQILKVCTVGTLLSFMPSCLVTFRRPTKKNFILSLIISSFSFFFFSFHTHEKTILIPMLVLSLLILEHPYIVTLSTMFSCFSMFPLLYRDGLLIPYICLTLLYIILSKLYFEDQIRSYYLISGLIAVAIHIIDFTVKPPEKYPYLFDLFITSFSFMNFFIVFLLAYTTHFWETDIGERLKAKEE